MRLAIPDQVVVDFSISRLHDPDPQREQLFRAILGSPRLGDMPFASGARRVLVCQRCGELGVLQGVMHARGATHTGVFVAGHEHSPAPARPWWARHPPAAKREPVYCEVCQRARAGVRVGMMLVCDDCRAAATRAGRTLDSLLEELGQRRYILWFYGTTEQLSTIAAWGSGMPVRPPWAPSWAPDQLVHPERLSR